MIQRLYLVFKELGGSRFISAIVLLSIALSVFAAGLYRIIGDNLENYVRNRFASSIPPNTIKVSTRQPSSMFLFELNEPKSPGIDDKVLHKIRTMEGVKEIYPVSALKIPLQAEIRYLGSGYRSDILAFGVSYPMVAGEIRDERFRRLWKEPEKEKMVPVLVPRNILHSYNDGMAEANGLPRISEQGAVGFGFRLLLGKSSVKRVPGFVESDAVIVGFTDQVDSLAIIVPLKLVIDYNRNFNQGRDNDYQYLYVKVKDHSSLVRIASRIKELGLVVEAQKSVSRQIMRLVDAVDLIIKSLQLIIITIAAVAISFATLIATLNRIEYYRTLRVLGCSRLFLTGTIFFKYAVLGLAGAWCGTMLLSSLARQFAEYFQLTGVMASLSVSPDTLKTSVIYGVLIPVLSTVPALMRLYSKGLSRD